MKKLIIAALFISSTAATYANSHATGHNSRSAKKEMRRLRHLATKHEVSYLSIQQFQSDFPGATNVRYRAGANFDEVAFRDADGQQKVAYYDFYNSLIGTTQAVDFSKLPEGAQKEIQNKYADYHIGPVIYFKDNLENESDMILFSQSFADADNYFVELNGPKNIILKVSKDGIVSYFTDHLK